MTGELAAEFPASGCAAEFSAAELSAVELVAVLKRRNESIAVAESLTGGLLAAEVVSVPGASTIFRGGITAYQNEIKTMLLDVDAALLAEKGAVCAEVALEMAEGARARFGAHWAVATTGVAGPGSADGVPAGTVFIAVIGADKDTAVRGNEIRRVEKYSLSGDRFNVRRATVMAALELIIGEISRI